MGNGTIKGNPTFVTKIFPGIQITWESTSGGAGTGGAIEKSVALSGYTPIAFSWFVTGTGATFVAANRCPKRLHKSRLIQPYAESVMTSTLLRQIHEIKSLSVETAKNNSDNAYISATIPDGYKFLCWTRFTALDYRDYALSYYNDDTWENVRVWTGQVNSGRVRGNYLVYR